VSLVTLQVLDYPGWAARYTCSSSGALSSVRALGMDDPAEPVGAPRTSFRSARLIRLCSKWVPETTPRGGPGPAPSPSRPPAASRGEVLEGSEGVYLVGLGQHSAVLSLHHVVEVSSAQRPASHLPARGHGDEPDLRRMSPRSISPAQARIPLDHLGRRRSQKYDRGMLRFLTAGESHGRALVVVVEGLPAGLPVTVAQIGDELARRRLGYGRGPRMRFERDAVTLVGGVRHGRTLGSPVAIEIANTEWPRWEQELSPDPGVPSRRLTAPRPGHADLSGMLKYGFDDARDVLERASARETAARVAAGALAKALLSELGMSVLSHVVALGAATAPPGARPQVGDLDRVDASEVRCFDEAAGAAMVAEVKAAAKVGDSLGGVVEVLAYGVPVGLGSHVHWDRKLDGLLAQALMSIQAVKGVEIGDAFEVASRRGSDAHDPIGWDERARRYTRATSRAGGIEGGISSGALLVARAAMKPLATLNRPVLKTVDVDTKEETVSFKERTDVTAVPAMGVVAETMVALVLAGEALRKFGGDSVAEIRRNQAGFLDGLEETPSVPPLAHRVPLVPDEAP